MLKKSIIVVLVLLMAAAAFADNVSYVGAFGPTNWAKGWTALDSYGILAADKVAGGVVEVTDADIPDGAQVYWTADNTYLLKGRVFVNPGAELYIEAGTVIKGAAGTGESASVLVVARGGKIFAEGRADAPIIFTGEADDVTNPMDIEYNAAELWGGVIILGAAPTNKGENNIEGIPDEPRALYGGDDVNDNSGVLRYVSIRHGGIEIGEGNEINGLTMGGVGAGTTIEYVEVFSNKDDGFEWFGGTVNCKHLIAAFCRDDSYDMDEGLNNKLQFVFAIQDVATGDCLGEHDGASSSNTTAEPKTNAHVYNATYIGSGMTAETEASRALRLRENWGGSYKNSIIGCFDGYGVTVENTYSPNDSKDRMDAGELMLDNNIWFNISAGTEWANIAKDGETWTADYLAANGNLVVDPQFKGMSRVQDGGMDPRPAIDGPAFTTEMAETPADGFFEQVPYKGAFGATNWAKGWTALDSYGFLPAAPTAGGVVEVTDADIPDGATVVWTADNTYKLNGRVFVNPGATLIIEAGTVIKGAAGTGESASVLVVARGGKVFAEGTGVAPIIFTGEADDVNIPVDVEFDAAELWGGLIILGAAPTNKGENNIEGIPDEPRALYGGDDVNDCSGIYRYVSVRHGGIEIGEGNEINGITMGGVGAGTTMEYCEVFSNKDDGFEWFGGTVNADHLVAAFCRDDSYDIDEGLNNKMQFLFAIQGATTGDCLGEHDGASSSNTTAEPKTNAMISNVTYLGSGKDAATDASRALRLRENWGGYYMDSIIGQHEGYGVTVESEYSPNDCKERMAAGELSLKNNIWFDLGAGTLAEEIAKSGETWTAAYLADPANMNSAVNPMLAGVSRTMDAGLDPRPAFDGPAFDAALRTGLATTVETRWNATPVAFDLAPNFPNPFNPVTTIDYKIDKAGQVNLSIYNELGQQVATLVNDKLSAGSYQINWDASQMATGVYFYRLETADKVMTRKMMLVK